MSRKQLIAGLLAASMVLFAGCSSGTQSESSTPDESVSEPASSTASSKAESSEPESSSAPASSSEAESSSAPARSSGAESSAPPVSSSQPAENITPDTQNPTSSSSEAQTPASQPSGNAASSQSGQASASSAGVNRNASQMSEKERAEALMKLMDLEVLDWVTPANELTAGMNQFIFSCSDFNNSGSIIAYINGSDWGEDDLKAYGYYYPEASILGWVKAFNDYRGVETDVVVYGGLDDSLENWYGYQYDEASDSFEEVLIPVGGNGSTTSDSNKATDETTSGSKNEGNSGSKIEEPINDSASSSTSVSLDDAIKLVNEHRVANGLSELVVDDDLMDLAAVRAEELTEDYSHTRPDGTSVTSLGYAEIITKRDTAATAIQSWKDSTAHNKIMLSERYASVGVGYSDGYWAMLFSK